MRDHLQHGPSAHAAALPLVVVNCTRREAAALGGDFSTAATIVEVGGTRYQFRHLGHRPLLPDICRRLVGRTLLGSGSPTVRGLGRTIYFQAPVWCSAETDQRPIIVLSVVLFPRQLQPRQYPVVWYSQGLMSESFYRRWTGRPTWLEYRRLYVEFAARSALVAVATKVGLRRLCEKGGVPPQKCKYVPIPCQPPPLVNLADKGPFAPRILFVGRDWLRKGLSQLLHAVAEVERRGLPVELDVVTVEDCPLKRSFPATAARRWHSNLQRGQLLDLYRRSWLCAAPTQADTYNLSMVEAMGQGCAVVTSRIDCLEEVAPPGVVGEVVDIGDVAALVASIEGILGNEETCRRYAAAAVDLYARRNYWMSAMPILEDALDCVEVRGCSMPTSRWSRS